MFRQCCPQQSLFVNPIFNLQHYAPGEGFKRWHCDWTISDEATEPVHRVLAWILYCNDVDEAGTEFHWQDHHEPAERGKLVIFPAGPSHIHRGRGSESASKRSEKRGKYTRKNGSVSSRHNRKKSGVERRQRRLCAWPSNVVNKARGA